MWLQNTAAPAALTPVKQPRIADPLSAGTKQLRDAWNYISFHWVDFVSAIALIVVAWLVAKLIAMLIRKSFHHRGRVDLGIVLGSLASAAILVLAWLMAAAIVFPSVQPGNIISALGVGSVAIGFAFKDILQNLLAGILLLINRPFRRGDQIAVKDFEGTVEHIENRATIIKTYDGRRVIIPNADIYTSPVTVNTAFPIRRDQFDIGIGYGDKPSRAADLIRDAIAKVEGVEADPAPEVLPWGLGESDVQLRARWWVKSLRTDVVHTRARVILAIFETCLENGIDLPFPTQMILLHDQTEETDGDRTRQREGWPAGDHPPAARLGSPDAKDV